MNKRLSFSSYFVIGIMLFALFFGAGNLIFPAELGQNAGTQLWPAILGFLVTGVGLPFLGILVMGVSGSKNLQELSSRVHPIYGIFFTALLYLTIGPFFAAPRTGAVAYDIGISPFVGKGYEQMGLLIFTFIFFAATLWFSLNPAKLVERIGKLLSPGIIILLLALLAVAIINPIGPITGPQEAYAHDTFLKGFTEGYNTMDALASLVFGIIVINAIRAMGVTRTSHVLSATAKSGAVAAVFLGIIYVGIAYLGATTTKTFGLFDTGGPVLAEAASHYFGMTGTIMLSIVILLACLTTSIGLMTACGAYFHTLFPKVSYKLFTTLFTLITFIIANFGLANIIQYSVPVLVFLYPLAMVLMLLTFLSPLFKNARVVYMTATVVTFFISIVDGIVSFMNTFKLAFPDWLSAIIKAYDTVLPLYSQGLGWLIPALIVIVITGVPAWFHLSRKPSHAEA